MYIFWRYFHLALSINIIVSEMRAPIFVAMSHWQLLPALSTTILTFWAHLRCAVPGNIHFRNWSRRGKVAQARASCWLKWRAK